MTYALLDDGFYDCPTFALVPDDLVGIWAKGLAYCNRHLTDGWIPVPKALSFCVSVAPETVVERMIKTDLWALGTGKKTGLVEHVGYLDHNPSKKEVLARRKAATDRKNKWKTTAQGTRSATRSSHDLGTCSDHDLGTLPNPIRSNPIQSDPTQRSKPRQNAAPRGTLPLPSAYDIGRDVWRAAWSSVKGEAYGFLGPMDRREGATLRWLGEQAIANGGDDPGGWLAGRLAAYLKLDDTDIIKAGHPLAWVQKRFNGLRVGAVEPEYAESAIDRANRAECEKRWAAEAKVAQ
jgi:hypothetical protein